MTAYAVVLVTAGSAEEAGRIGRTLVEERLAACANIVPQVRSLYHWEGKLCDEAECLIVFKVRAGDVEAIVRRVQALHSYTVPEVIAVPILAGSPAYLAWLGESTARE
jgi:periplasmic divalent cation tolerance protein